MTDPTDAALEAARATESEIAEEAKGIRVEATKLDHRLFMELWPLLSRPIPTAFIRHVPKLQSGKPYPSTGVSSVQVLIDRTNNVLTPLWWWDLAEYKQEGRVCQVTIFIGDPTAPHVLRSFTSWGGVDRGSSMGNVYKGSYTNAAKRAFAALGPGHEVYLGAADLDPDVSRDAAGGGDEPGTVGTDIAGNLYKRAKELGLEGRLQLTASTLAGRDIGDCSTKAKATEALSALTFKQANELEGRLNRRADEMAAKQ